MRLDDAARYDRRIRKAPSLIEALALLNAQARGLTFREGYRYAKRRATRFFVEGFLVPLLVMLMIAVVLIASAPTRAPVDAQHVEAPEER